MTGAEEVAALLDARVRDRVHRGQVAYEMDTSALQLAAALIRELKARVVELEAAAETGAEECNRHDAGPKE